MPSDGLGGRLPDPVVVKFYLYMATLSNAFITPITVVYMQSKGVGLAGVGAVQALFWVGLTLAEVPTGYVSDRFGHRTSLFFATTTIGAAILGFWFADGVVGFGVVYLVWSVGITFRSGSLGAWLYDTLEARLSTDEFARVRGRGGSVVLGVSAAGSLAGAPLYEIDPLYPFVCTAALAGLGLVVLWTFPTADDHPASDETDGTGAETLEFVQAIRTARRHLTGRELRWFVAYTGALYVAHQVVSAFIQPAALASGLSVAQLGPLYAAITGLSAVASWLSGTVERRLGVRGWFTLAPLLVGVPLLVTAVSPLAALPAIAGVRFVDKLSGTLRKQYINDRVSSVGRATVLSAVSMVFGVVTVPARVLGGVVGDGFSVFVTFAGVGVVVLLVAGGIHATREPFVERTQSRAGGEPSD
ncbi:MFS transporter [Halobaculum sp. MBLA0143]|uniref:MFS transporter n=1 Tax=Halobaculum sp. MBLA0143 TaxID=3079933 RepID=UPI003523C25F